LEDNRDVGSGNKRKARPKIGFYDPGRLETQEMKEFGVELLEVTDLAVMEAQRNPIDLVSLNIKVGYTSKSYMASLRRLIIRGIVRGDMSNYVENSMDEALATIDTNALHDKEVAVTVKDLLVIACCGKEEMISEVMDLIDRDKAANGSRDIREAAQRFDYLIGLMRRRTMRYSVLVTDSDYVEPAGNLGTHSVMIKVGGKRVIKEHFSNENIRLMMEKVVLTGDVSPREAMSPFRTDTSGEYKKQLGFQVTCRLRIDSRGNRSMQPKFRMISTTHIVAPTSHAAVTTRRIERTKFDDDEYTRECSRIVERMIIRHNKDTEMIYIACPSHDSITNRLFWNEARVDTQSKYKLGAVKSVLDDEGSKSSRTFYGVAVYDRKKLVGDTQVDCRIRVLSMESIRRNVYGDWGTSSGVIDTPDAVMKAMTILYIIGTENKDEYEIVDVVGLEVRRCERQAHISSRTIHMTNKMESCSLKYELVASIFGNTMMKASLRETKNANVHNIPKPPPPTSNEHCGPVLVNSEVLDMIASVNVKRRKNNEGKKENKE
jgi:hypothetical protein